MIPAAGIPLALHAPDRRCLTMRSPLGFRSATRCFRSFHNSLTPLDGPHDACARTSGTQTSCSHAVDTEGREGRVFVLFVAGKTE